MILGAIQAAAFTNTCRSCPCGSCSQALKVNITECSFTARPNMPVKKTCSKPAASVLKINTYSAVLPSHEHCSTVTKKERMKARNVLQVKSVMWGLKWKPPFLIPCSLSSLFDHRGKPVLPQVAVCLQNLFQCCLFFDPSCYRESIKSIFLWNATWCLYGKNIISYWQGCSHLWVFFAS